ncbi:MAG: plastocyanin/azurin family copper-binding protein [Gaiellaceae bacterium]
MATYRLGTYVAIMAVALIGASPARGHPAAAQVKVIAGKPSEFRFTLSTKTVHKGLVVFNVSNRGTIPHDFKIDGKKTPLLTPGRSATLKVVFSKAGRYRYLCTVPGHATAGMKGILTVK